MAVGSVGYTLDVAGVQGAQTGSATLTGGDEAVYVSGGRRRRPRSRCPRPADPPTRAPCTSRTPRRRRA